MREILFKAKTTKKDNPINAFNNVWVEGDLVRSSGLSGYGVIKYQNGNLVLVDAKRKRTYSMYGEWKIRKDGNIFDNAELLEVE